MRIWTLVDTTGHLEGTESRWHVYYVENGVQGHTETSDCAIPAELLAEVPSYRLIDEIERRMRATRSRLKAPGQIIDYTHNT